LCFQVVKIEDSIDFINCKTKPLAAYLFTKNKKLQDNFVANVPAGGMLVNDIALHVSPAHRNISFISWLRHFAESN
jgi:acyl-CoA reductase-like NAD-dependent aldehyde dehydrogenase